MGIPVDQLSKAWGLNGMVEGAFDSAKGLAGFVDGLGDRAEGWIRIEGEEVAAQGGTDEVVAVLGEGAAVFLDGYYAHKDEFEAGKGPLGLVFSTKTGESVVFIDAGEAMAFIRADAVAAYAVANDWQQLAAL